MDRNASDVADQDLEPFNKMKRVDTTCLSSGCYVQHIPDHMLSCNEMTDLSYEESRAY